MNKNNSKIFRIISTKQKGLKPRSRRIKNNYKPRNKIEVSRGKAIKQFPTIVEASKFIKCSKNYMGVALRKGEGEYIVKGWNVKKIS